MSIRPSVDCALIFKSATSNADMRTMFFFIVYLFLFLISICFEGFLLLVSINSTTYWYLFCLNSSCDIDRSNLWTSLRDEDIRAKSRNTSLRIYFNLSLQVPTSNVCTLLGQASVSQGAAGMLTVRHIHITDDVHNPAVCFLRQTLVLTTVTCFHVEKWGYAIFRSLKNTPFRL